MLGAPCPKSTGGVAKLPVQRGLKLPHRNAGAPAADARLADEAGELVVGAPERLQQAGVDGPLYPRRGGIAGLVERLKCGAVDFEQQRILSRARARSVHFAVELAHRPQPLAR